MPMTTAACQGRDGDRHGLMPTEESIDCVPTCEVKIGSNVLSMSKQVLAPRSKVVPQRQTFEVLRARRISCMSMETKRRTWVVRD